MIWPREKRHDTPRQSRNARGAMKRGGGIKSKGASMKQEPVVLRAAGPIRANDTISQARLAESEVLEPETRDMRIVPAGLMESPPAVVTSRKSEPDRMLRLGLQPPNAQLELPLFARQYDTALRASPLLLADAAGFRGLTPGVGARLDKRLWMYALLHAPITQRQVPVVYHWTPTLEELNALVWDTQWRVRKAERLEAALDAVTLAKVQLPERPAVAARRGDEPAGLQRSAEPCLLPADLPPEFGIRSNRQLATADRARENL